MVVRYRNEQQYVEAILAGRLDPDLVRWGYAHGIFPMADPDTGKIDWYDPDPRAIFDLNAFHVPHTLRPVLHSGRFRVTLDRAFERVIRACGDRASTWISEPIIRCYTGLHEQGSAHSVEAWLGDELAGGLYGVAIGGAFFGESMFHAKTHGSKVALAGLVRQLRRQGFLLLDIQFVTSHLARFGGELIPRTEYLRRLNRAIRKSCSFARAGQESVVFD